jgi:hypothetical protein
VANPVLPQRSHRPEVQGDKGVSTQPLPLKGDDPIDEASTSLLRDQASFHRCTSKPNSHRQANIPMYQYPKLEDTETVFLFFPIGNHSQRLMPS